MSYPPPGGPEGGEPGGPPPPSDSPSPPPPGFGTPPPQPPWGPPAYGYGYGIPQAHPQGTTALVLGIIGIVLIGICGFLGLFLSIPAWVIGHKARQEVQQNPGAYSNSGMVTAGWVLGIVGTCLQLAMVALVALFIIIGAASG